LDMIPIPNIFGLIIMFSIGFILGTIMSWVFRKIFKKESE